MFIDPKDSIYSGSFVVMLAPSLKYHRFLRVAVYNTMQIPLKAMFINDDTPEELDLIILQYSPKDNSLVDLV